MVVSNVSTKEFPQELIPSLISANLFSDKTAEPHVLGQFTLIKPQTNLPPTTPGIKHPLFQPISNYLSQLKGPSVREQQGTSLIYQEKINLGVIRAPEQPSALALGLLYLTANPA
jgi:hypothetical protein